MKSEAYGEPKILCANRRAVRVCGKPARDIGRAFACEGRDSRPFTCIAFGEHRRPGARSGRGGLQRRMMKKRSASTKPTVSVDTFRDDPLYPRIVRAVQKLLAREKVVAPIDVLVNMSLLRSEQVEDWRRGCRI